MINRLISLKICEEALRKKGNVCMGKLFRKHWMEDKDREKLLKIARKAIQDFCSNPNKFFDISVLEQEEDITVCIETTQEFIRFAEDVRQIAKMIRNV